MHHLQDTIIALATPPGVGAIGVIRLSGAKAIDLAASRFKGKNLAKQKSHTLHFGTITDDKGIILDEVLAAVFIAPHSYTGENVVEISCHGSSYILQQIIQLFITDGARLAQPGEFTLRAFLNGKMDLSQAEAVADLIASTSAAAHAVAMQQMRGGISDEIKQLREELIHFASLIELELDFSEEDVEFANRDSLKELVYRIQRYLRALLQSFHLGNAIRTGVTTVIAGRPNAGKSTLLNALLNEERAIVSEIAGTTRDTVEEVLNINGVQFRLVDTAGIREATDTIEALGVARTLEKVEQAAILVYVFDVLETRLDAVFGDLERLRRKGLQVIVVCNKMDTNPYFRPEWLSAPDLDKIPAYYLNESADTEAFRAQLPGWTLPAAEQVITISAKAGMNIPYLKEKLFDIAVGELQPESTIVSNARHYEALSKADASLSDVLHGLQSGITSDFIAMDIRRALTFLGEITGEVGVEDLLENIFSKFCIGK